MRVEDIIADEEMRDSISDRVRNVHQIYHYADKIILSLMGKKYDTLCELSLEETSDDYEDRILSDYGCWKKAILETRSVLQNTATIYTTEHGDLSSVDDLEQRIFKKLSASEETLLFRSGEELATSLLAGWFRREIDKASILRLQRHDVFLHQGKNNRLPNHITDETVKLMEWLVPSVTCAFKVAKELTSKHRLLKAHRFSDTARKLSW